MSMKQRLVRDSSGYMSGTSGSYVEFTLPVMTSNIEKQDYGANILRYEQIDEGDSYSYSFMGNWEYWDGSKWIALFTGKTLYCSGSAEDNRKEVDCYSWYTDFTNDTFKAKMQELNGKRVRWYSNSSPVYNDVNSGSAYYLELWTYYKQPTVGDPTFSRDYINSAVNINITLSNTETYTVSLNGKQYTNTKSIPESAFVVGNNTITINAINGDMSASKVVSYNFVDYNPVAKTISFTNSTLDYDTTVEVTATNAQRYDLYVNGVFKYTSNTQVFIPPKSSFSLGENSVFVRCYNTTSMRYADTSTYKKTFTTLQPTVSNLTFKNTGDKGNNLTHNPTVFTWQGTNYDYFNIYVNDIIKAKNINALTYTIPSYTIPYGQSTIKIEVVKNALEGIANTEIKKYLNSTITLDSINPTVGNIQLSSTNIDRDITVTWDSKYQDAFEISKYGANDKYLGAVTSTVISGDANSYIIPRGGLSIDVKKLKILVLMTTDNDDIEGYGEVAVNLTCDMPVIYNLEPSNLSRNIDDPIRVTFATNEYVGWWELQRNNEICQIGTTNREVVFGAGTFIKGENVLTLTGYYRPPYATASPTRQVIKTVTFTGYGKPNPAILSGETIYSTSIPIIRWSTNPEQVGYAYELYKGNDLITSDVVDSKDNFLSLSDIKNSSTYTIKIKIKNKYDLYSEWSSKTFSTLFNNIIIPEFFITLDRDNVNIAIDGLQDPNFKKLSIYRKTKYSNWVMIADNCNVVDTIIDYAYQAGTEVEYKLRVYNTSDAYAESESIVVVPTMLNYSLTNVENWKDTKQLEFVSASYSTNRNVVSKIYSGARVPRVFKGKTLYDSISLNVEMENQEAYEFIYWLETANDYNIFLYRSWKGEKKYVVAQYNGMQSVNAMVTSVSLILTEVDFIEEKLYMGSGYRKIVYLDGSYFLDGSIDLSGYDDSVIAPYEEVMTLEEL